MKNFLIGLGVGIPVGYLFHRDIDRAVRQALERASEQAAAGATTTP